MVHVGEIATVPVTLSVSSSAQTVLVTSSSELLDSTNPGVSALVSQREINDLPINGRRVDQFVLLTPGVTTDGADGQVTFRGVPGNNPFLQDGMDVTQQWGQDDAGSTSAFSPLSQDAVQEFQVLTSGYTAEFGHAAGGIVNTLTKSGTNNFHGSAFEFFKNRTSTQPILIRLTPPALRSTRPTGGTSLAAVLVGRSGKTSYSSSAIQKKHARAGPWCPPPPVPPI